MYIIEETTTVLLCRLQIEECAQLMVTYHVMARDCREFTKVAVYMCT